VLVAPRSWITPTASNWSSLLRTSIAWFCISVRVSEISNPKRQPGPSWSASGTPTRDSILLGVDLVKSPDLLLAAYDDAEGVTAASMAICWSG